MRVEWDEAAFQRWLRDPSGPVMARVMPGLGQRVVKLARATFHKITGETAASLGYEVGSDSQGPFCAIGGNRVVRFLEKPAGQMHRPYRWLTDAFRAVAGGR